MRIEGTIEKAEQSGDQVCPIDMISEQRLALYGTYRAESEGKRSEHGNMDPNSTNDNLNNKRGKLTRPVLLLWIIPLLLLLLIAGIAVIGVYLLEQSDSDITTQLKGLGILVIIIVVISLIGGSLCLYSSVRYIQLPAWRWMANGFKGKPVVPWLQKSKRNQSKMAIESAQKESEHCGAVDAAARRD